MKKLYAGIFVSIVVLSLCWSRCLGAEVELTDAELRKMTINSVKVEGNLNVKEEDILDKIHSRKGYLFAPERAEEDAGRIADEVTGVAIAKWDRRVVDNKIELVFVIEEEAVVRSIKFIGNKRIKAKTLRKKLAFKVGDYLEGGLAETGREKLEEFYLKQGFAFAEVELDSNSVQLLRGEVIYKIHVKGETREGPRLKIKSVKFDAIPAIEGIGIDVKTRKIAKKVIKTNKKKRFLWPKYYTEEAVANDVATLQELYYRRGFLDSKVRAKLEPNMPAEEPKKDSRVGITFEVKQGPLCKVDKIDFKFIDTEQRNAGHQYFNQETLREMLRLKQDETYRERMAEMDVERLIKFYRERGFINAKVEHRPIVGVLEEIQVPVDEARVPVEFEITEGERFRIGQRDITGNQRTQVKSILRVLDEYDFRPPKSYNADIAPEEGGGELEEEIQRRVFAKTVSIRPLGQGYDYNPDEDEYKIDAEVEIEEGKTGAWHFGGGVSSDSGVMGQLVFEQRNFNIRDWPENFVELFTGRRPSRGAGQSLRIALEPGTEVSQYSVSFTEPYFRDRAIALDMLGQSYERARESYDEGRLKGYVGFEQRYQRRYRDRWLKSIGFRLENVNVGSLDTDAPKEIVSDKGDNTLAGIKVGARKDLTDDRFNPGKGYILDTSYEQVGGDHTFGILSGTHRRYSTLHEDLAGRRTILATKLHAATVLGDAPCFEKFYAGGTGFYGIRGFDYRGVSTRGLQRNVPNPKRKDPVGSDWIFLANAEVAVPLTSEAFAALFFVDSGAIDTGNYRAAVGTGIQIQIPQWFGPVPMRFAIAAPLMKDDDDDTQVFSFSVGRLF